MTQFDRLMREADLDKLRAKVVEAAKAWYEHNSGAATNALFHAVDELLRMEEKR